MKPVELAYIAGLVDGEAYIGIKKSKAYECQGRKTPGYHARMQIRMVDESAIKFIAQKLGGWYYKEKPVKNNRRMLYCYQASDKNAASIIIKLLPFLRVKRQTARTVIQLRKLQANGRRYRTKIVGYREFHHHCGKVFQVANKSFSDKYVQKCETLYLRCKSLNRVGTE